MPPSPGLGSDAGCGKQVLDQSCIPCGGAAVSRMDPAGARELHLPGGATSLRDSIKDELSPVPWPVPARRDLGARTPQGKRAGRGLGQGYPKFWGVTVG